MGYQGNGLSIYEPRHEKTCFSVCKNKGADQLHSYCTADLYFLFLPSEFPPNVAYQEFDLPDSFPLYLRKYIPNVPNRRIGDDGLDQSQMNDR